jgi:hypothetical protein
VAKALHPLTQSIPVIQADNPARQFLGFSWKESGTLGAGELFGRFYRRGLTIDSYVGAAFTGQVHTLKRYGIPHVSMRPWPEANRLEPIALCKSVELKSMTFASWTNVLGCWRQQQTSSNPYLTVSVVVTCGQSSLLTASQTHNDERFPLWTSERHQRISTTGTSWASIAIAFTLPDK